MQILIAKASSRQRWLTVSDADHDVSPLSEDAVQVYMPESSRCKSEKGGKGNRNEYKITSTSINSRAESSQFAFHYCLFEHKRSFQLRECSMQKSASKNILP